MATKLRVGKDCFTYYNSAATYETPTWVEAKQVRDESIDLAKSKAEFMSRESKFKRKKGALIEAPATLTIEYRAGDAFIAKLWDSFVNNTPIDMAFMFDTLPPAAGTTSEGIRMPIEVFDFPFARDLEDGCLIEVGVEMTEKLKADNSAQDLEWYEVAAGGS